MRNNLITAFLTAIIVIGAFYSFGFTQTDNEMPDITMWPEASQKAIKDMEVKYGKPDEFTPSMLIWKNNGVWLKTIVYKKGMKHAFPEPHSDVIEQWINYQIPFSNYNKLAIYDGSITVNRTNGTISSRCSNETMNIIALNLAYDIIKNNKDIDQARKDFQTYIIAGKKSKSEYAQHLMFNSDPSAPDSDEPAKSIAEQKNAGGPRAITMNYKK